MTRVSLLPHRCASTGVDAAPWTLRIAGVDVAPADVDAVWDRRAPIELHSQFAARPAEVREGCGLDAAAPLALVATWYAHGTSIRRVVARRPIVDDTSHHLSCTIDATDVAGELVVERRIVLDRAHPSADPLVAAAAGSILWRETPAARLVIALDVAVERLSIEAVDFSSRADLDSRAAWTVEVAVDDIDADARGALRLVVNTSHPAIADLVAGGDRRRRAQVASVVRWDVGRRLLDALLVDDRFVDRFGELSGGSIGAVAQSIIEQRWPGDSARTLRDRRASSRGAFDAEVQARLGLLESPRPGST